MAVGKFLARIGSVGGTARWSAKMYHHLNKQYPGINGKELHSRLVLIRYPKAHENAHTLLEMCDQMKGLRGFAAMVLAVEAGMLDNNKQTIDIFMEVIDEELNKAGISELIANG